jgi:hypothetical protein
MAVLRMGQKAQFGPFTLKLWAFGSNIFQNFNFYPKLYFL